MFRNDFLCKAAGGGRFLNLACITLSAFSQGFKDLRTRGKMENKNAEEKQRITLYFNDGSTVRRKNGILISSDGGRYVIKNEVTGGIEEYPFSSVLRIEYENGKLGAGK